MARFSRQVYKTIQLEANTTIYHNRKCHDPQITPILLFQKATVERSSKENMLIHRRRKHLILKKSSPVFLKTSKQT